jgi:hypothetical protein
MDPSYHVNPIPHVPACQTENSKRQLRTGMLCKFKVDAWLQAGNGFGMTAFKTPSSTLQRHASIGGIV